MSSAWKFFRHKFNSFVFAIFVADCLLCILALQRAERLSDFIYFHFGLTGLLFCPLLALIFFFKRQLDQPLPVHALTFALLTTFSIALLLGLSETHLVNDVLGIIHRRFQKPYWQGLGLALAAAICLPLIGHALRSGIRQRRYADFLVCMAFLVFLVLLFLPDGFDSIGHWETWNYRAYLEGQFSWNVSYELTTRFWVAVPHLLATIISPDSFVGFHLAHLVIIWGKLVLLYGILRKLKFSRLYAFLATMLFMVYPVNSALLSLRSLPNQFSIMSLLAAGYLILDYRDNQSRLRLLGIWLSLIFNVVTNETAYVIILVAPIIWIWTCRRAAWKNANLTLIWYLFPLCKVAHLLVLSALNLNFYNSSVVEGSARIDGGAAGSLVERLVGIYRHTFVEAWREALLVFDESPWLPQSLLLLVVVAAVGWYLKRSNDNRRMQTFDQARLALLGGIAFVIPAVGVLIWLDQYSGDLWRTYFYVPIGAAVAFISLIMLVTSPIKRSRLRRILVLVICLGLIFPATARLFGQRGRFVASARAKAEMLNDLMRLIPAIEADTRILLTTDMTEDQLNGSDIYEFLYSNDLDNAMLYVLYGNGVPVQSTFCLTAEVCSTFGGEETMFTSPNELPPRTLVIEISRDLSVKLIGDPAAYFGLSIDVSYDHSRLYSSDAPLPRRALIMLRAE